MVVSSTILELVIYSTILELVVYRIYGKDRHTGKIVAGGNWASKSGETPFAVTDILDVTPTDVP